MATRIAKLKEKYLDAQPTICWERGKIITDSYQSTEGMAQVVRRAIAFRDILEKMTVLVDEVELIVGNQGAHYNSAPLFPEFSVSFLVDEADAFDKRDFDRFEIDARTKEVIREIAPYWRGKTHEDRVIHLTRSVLPDDYLPAWEEDKFRLNDILYDGVRRSSGDGHIIPNYFRLMEVSIPGVIEEAKNALAALDLYHDPEAYRKKSFLDSVIISYQAVANWFLRYAEQAEKKANVEVAAVCRSLAAGPPQSFHQAIQLAYSIHLLLHIESNGHSVSQGRVDQYLYPFYEKDTAAGILTKEQALVLIASFYMKTNLINKVRPWPETRNKSGAPMFMTTTLGGVDRNGKDSTNDLTYLFLEALCETKLPQPTLIIRVHADTPKELLLYASEALYRHGGGLPAFFSDESILPALMKNGIPLEDAREYAICGCSEAVIPGKSLSFTGGDCYYNVLKIIEILLNEGVNPRTGHCLIPAKKLEEYQSIEDFLAEFRRHLAIYVSYVTVPNHFKSESIAH